MRYLGVKETAVKAEYIYTIISTVKWRVSITHGYVFALYRSYSMYSVDTVCIDFNISEKKNVLKVNYIKNKNKTFL